MQGDGVTVILVGATYISPQGVTSTTFHAVPDDPVGHKLRNHSPRGKVLSFGHKQESLQPDHNQDDKEAVKVKVSEKLAGKTVKITKTVTRKTTKSVAEPLVMGNEYIGQNGSTYNANTALTVTGCPKVNQLKDQAQGQAPQEVVRSGAGVEYSFRPSRGTLPPEGLDCFHAVEMNIRLQPHSQ